MADFQQYELEEPVAQSGDNIVPIAGGSVVKEGFLQSPNFRTGQEGWRIDAKGDAEFQNLISNGTITATDGSIGGFEIGEDYVRDAANSMGIASTVTGGDDIRFWAGDTFANRATAPFRVSEAGSAVFKDIQLGGTTLQYKVTDTGNFSFGDGSDGDVTISSNTTLASDKYYNNLTIDSGFTLSPAGYRIFVKNTLTLNGTIARNGVNGSNGVTNGAGGAGGTALADGYLKGSLAGGNGGDSASGGAGGIAGTAGGNVSNCLVTANGSTAGAGGTGSGGGTNGGTAGAGGTTTASNVKLIANWHLATLLDIGATGATVKFNSSAAAGGGGSGGGGSVGVESGSGAGGGSNGGIISIYAKTIVISATGSITVTGGNGGIGGAGETAGGGSDNAGGGGGGAGGNGGVIVLAYNMLTNSGSITASAGTGGAGGAAGTGGGGGAGAAGATGSNGSAGTIYQFNLSL